MKIDGHTTKVGGQTTILLSGMSLQFFIFRSIADTDYSVSLWLTRLLIINIIYDTLIKIISYMASEKKY